MVSSLEQLRNKVTRKDLKAVTKIYEANLAEDHGKVVSTRVTSAVLFLQHAGRKAVHTLTCFQNS